MPDELMPDELTTTEEFEIAEDLTGLCNCDLCTDMREDVFALAEWLAAGEEAAQ